MCDACEESPKWKSKPSTPERLQELHEREVELVMEHGYTVRGVAGADDRPNFFYTLGRAVFDQPDILIVGNLAAEAVMQILGSIVDSKADLLALADSGETLGDILGGGYQVKFLRCDPEAADMTGAISMGGDDIDAVQMLWPDSDGNFPDQPGFERADVIQPIYAR